MLTTFEEEIVESRTWRNGIEIVSHVNWTLIGRVRRSLGITAEVHFESPVAAWSLAARAETSAAERRRSVLPRASKRLRLVVGDPELRRSIA